MGFKPIAKGLVAGLVGGFVASWVMNEFQMTLARIFGGEEDPHGAQALQRGSPQHGVGAELTRLGVEDQDDNSAERTANFIAAKAFDDKLSKDKKRDYGEVAHYMFGSTTGALYGLVSEVIPQATKGSGSLFGTGVWVLADEVTIPALGLSRSARSYPVSKHAYALASHIVYGITTELVRRTIRRVL
jgi:hypothetical protein